MPEWPEWASVSKPQSWVEAAVLDGIFANGSAFGGTPAHEIYRTQLLTVLFLQFKSSDCGLQMQDSHQPWLRAKW